MSFGLRPTPFSNRGLINRSKAKHRPIHTAVNKKAKRLNKRLFTAIIVVIRNGHIATIMPKSV
jgi:hypothetical protein